MTEETPVPMEKVRDILTRLLAIGTVVIPANFLEPLTNFLMGGELFNPYILDLTGRPWEKCFRPDGKKWPSSDMTQTYIQLILYSAFKEDWDDVRRHINDFNRYYRHLF